MAAATSVPPSRYREATSALPQSAPRGLVQLAVRAAITAILLVLLRPVFGG